MQNTMTLEMADGNVLNFHFGLGTVRKIKELTEVDPMKEELPGDWWDTAVVIFIASYLSACKVYKTPPQFTQDQLKDYFEEIDANTAVEFVKSFNRVMIVTATPEVVAAVKAAESAAQANNGEVVSTEKKQ